MLFSFVLCFSFIFVSFVCCVFRQLMCGLGSSFYRVKAYRIAYVHVQQIRLSAVQKTRRGETWTPVDRLPTVATNYNIASAYTQTYAIFTFSSIKTNYTLPLLLDRVSGTTPLTVTEDHLLAVDCDAYWQLLLECLMNVLKLLTIINVNLQTV